MTLSVTIAKADDSQPDPVVQLFTVAADITKLISNIVKLKNDPPLQKAVDVIAIISNLMDLSKDSKGIGNAFQYYPAEAQTFFKTLYVKIKDPTQLPGIIAGLKANSTDPDAFGRYFLSLGGVPPEKAAAEMAAIEAFVNTNVKLKNTMDGLFAKLADDLQITPAQAEKALISSVAKQNPAAAEILKISIQYINDTYNKSENPFTMGAVKNFIFDPNGPIAQSLSGSNKATNLASLPYVQKPDTTSVYAEALRNAATDVLRLVDNRIGVLAMNGGNLTEGDGVAAGDGMFDHYGVWVKGMLTQARQKEYGLTQGYKLNQSGVTVGADIGNTHKLGAAFSYTQTTVNGKDGHISKDRVRNYIGTVYGLYNFENNIFISGQGQYGTSKMKKSRDTNDLNHNKAYGKTKGTIFGGKMEAGYDYKTSYNENWHLIPSTGISHNKLNVKGYREQDSADTLTRQIDKRNSYTTSALFGIKTSYIVNMQTYNIVPEAHINISQILKQKNGASVVSIIDAIAPTTTPSAKAAKTTYVFGGSVQILQLKAFDITLGYDHTRSKKFYSNTGYLNLRVNF
ncbi:autotransporter outer membrane beta-barrel domain-containing protein [Candidatus Trichorickettsia mobilis]|nr:autotransporter outer membrane beta-barrel domain-containing protein [Candidatus Trichorickettsia mobilis]